MTARGGLRPPLAATLERRAHARDPGALSEAPVGRPDAREVQAAHAVPRAQELRRAEPGPALLPACAAEQCDAQRAAAEGRRELSSCPSEIFLGGLH